MLLDMELWSQPISVISVYRDNEAILGRVYSKMYNGKSRHIGLRHDYIRQLIESGTISIVYMCMYSYIDLTNSYNVFTIIDNLHCSLAFFFFSHYMLVLLVLLNIICAYTITLTQKILQYFHNY